MLLQAKAITLSHPITHDTLHIEAPVDPLFIKCFPELG